MSCRHL